MNKQQWKTEHRRRRMVRRWHRAGPYGIALKTQWMEMLIQLEWQELYGWGNPIPPGELQKRMKEAAQRPENWFLRSAPE